MRFTKTVTMRASPALATILTVLLLAACGSSGSPTTRAASSSASPSPSAKASPPSTTSAAKPAPGTSTTPTTSTTPASSGPSGSPPCRAADLALSFLGGQGATGHGELGFSLRNTGQQTCSTVGFPGIQFLNRAGNALPTLPTHTTNDFFGSVAEAQLTIAPGSIVSFRLGVTHGIASTVGCTTAYGLQVIPPNDTAALRAAIPNGAYECQTATVSPLARGTSAYQ